MVKAVTGDEAQLSLAEKILGEIQTQIGLVVGKLSSTLDRGFIFDLIPTPKNDAGEPACSIPGNAPRDDRKKGSKPKQLPTDAPVLLIDSDWVVEHARQVSRMLVGGVMVIGIYVCVSESVFKSSSMVLCQTLKSVSIAAPLPNDINHDRLLVNFNCSPRRWNCRNFDVSSNLSTSNLRPCDFKIGKVLSNLQHFKCVYNFELRLPVSNEGLTSKATWNEILRDTILSIEKDLSSAMAMVDGKLVDNGTPWVVEGRPYNLELLLPFMKNAPSKVSSCEEIAGIVFWRGSICSYAYANGKESVSQAVTDIKDDIIRTLRNRLDIVLEADADADEINDISEEQSEPKSCRESVTKMVLRSLREKSSLVLPRRVFVPWVGGIHICDYLQPLEAIEAVKDNCADIFSMDVDIQTILEPEESTALSGGNEFWELAAADNPQPFYSESKRESDSDNNRTAVGVRNYFRFDVVLAVLIVFLSILFALLFSKH